jgi:hypothetical protein
MGTRDRQLGITSLTVTRFSEATFFISPEFDLASKHQTPDDVTIGELPVMATLSIRISRQTAKLLAESHEKAIFLLPLFPLAGAISRSDSTRAA